MAVDFDFNGTFNEDDETLDGQPPEDFDGFDEGESDENEEEEEKKSRPNILRLIILVFFGIILLCACCALLNNFGIFSSLPIPGLGSDPAPVTVDTPVPEPTDAGQLPAETEEPTTPVEPTDESITPTEPTEESTVPTEPTEESTLPTDSAEEATVPTEPTEEVMLPSESTAEATTPTEPAAEATAVPAETSAEQATAVPTSQVQPTVEAVETASTPVAGPTVTPPLVVNPSTESCENNQAPVANAGGEYEAMRGKGQAIVNFDGRNSTDPDGTIVDYHWDFGDNSAPGSGAMVSHAYVTIGSYMATLSVTDNCGATSEDTSNVTIVGPTPPSETPIATPTVDPAVTPIATATQGFCYRVQPGDTLSGLAWQFGVAWADLAQVNGIPMHYFVIIGQGLFIPTEQITAGPNVYPTQVGDTLNNVAFQCGLTVATLAQANGLTPEATLTPGQALVIPLWQP